MGSKWHCSPLYRASKSDLMATMTSRRLSLIVLSIAIVVFNGAGAEPKRIEKPALFKTLVNPECSHCVDEAKRRARDLRADDRVLAWTRGKYDGGAVPLRFFLVPYRVISDTYGVWVYDADAGFVRGYEPSLDFTFNGWRNGVIVIKHKDGTLFSALTGAAFDGPRKGTVLKPLATIETDWGYWAQSNPGTVAYNMFEKYSPHDLPKRITSESKATRPAADARLIQDEMVYGLTIGNQARAYPLARLATNQIILDRVGTQDVVVLWFERTRTAAAYAPRMEAAAIPEKLTLEYNAQIAAAPFMDKETFSHWSIEGRAVEGPLKGKALVPLPGVQCKWFAWAAEYPKTEIYLPGGRQSAQRDEPAVARLIEGERP